MKNPIKRSRFLAMSVMSLVFTLGHLQAALVMDDFTTGYPAGGTGWNANWTYSYYRSTNSSATVKNTDPFPSGGNYLDIYYEKNVSTSGGYSAARRPWDTSDVSNLAAHQVSFDMRLNSATHWTTTGVGEILAFYASSTGTAAMGSYASLSNSWSLTFDGINGWQVLSGDGAGGLLTTAPTTSFLGDPGATIWNVGIDVDPVSNQFSVSVSNGVRTETWGDQSFAFIDPNSTAGNYLSFYTHTRTGVSIDYSIDNIAVVPEPNTVATLLMAGVILGGFAMRRKSGVECGEAQ